MSFNFNELSEYQNKMINEILSWFYSENIFDIDSVYDYAKENCLEWFVFLSDNDFYNFEILHAILSCDEVSNILNEE